MVQQAYQLLLESGKVEETVLESIKNVLKQFGDNLQMFYAELTQV